MNFYAIHSRRLQTQCPHCRSFSALTCGMQIVLFSMGGVQALAAALTPLCAWLLPHQTINPPIGEVFVHSILSFGLSIATVAVWLIFRTSSWAWIVQDLLGMSLIVMVLRQFRLPNIKVSNRRLLSVGPCKQANTCCVCAYHSALLQAPFKLGVQHFWMASFLLCCCLCLQVCKHLSSNIDKITSTIWFRPFCLLLPVVLHWSILDLPLYASINGCMHSLFYSVKSHRGSRPTLFVYSVSDMVL